MVIILKLFHTHLPHISLFRNVNKNSIDGVNMHKQLMICIDNGSTIVLKQFA